VVEDDEATRAVLNRMLVGEGWAVSTAANGLEALERVEAARPDLILLDLMMPEMDGFDFLVELHKRPGAAEIPVVVVTAADLTEADYRRLNGAAEHVLRKAAHPQEDLLEELRGLVARYLGDDAEKDGRHADA
jgi:CheY-like chemotaxis protein